MREKRRFIRFDVGLKVKYIVQREPKIERFGTTKDVSASGMQIVTSDKLEPGDKLEIKLFVPKALNPVHLKGAVLWSREQNSGIDFKKIEEDNKHTFLQFLCDLMYEKAGKKKGFT